MTEDESTASNFADREASRRSQRWVPTLSGESGAAVGSILTGDELTLTFDKPEFDAPAVIGHMEARDSGIAEDPEEGTIVQRLEYWARDREYDFTRTTRPEYVEGFRDAQGIVLGLIQAWEDPGQVAEPTDAEVLAAIRAYADDRFRYGHQNRTVGSMRVASDLYAILGLSAEELPAVEPQGQQSDAQVTSEALRRWPRDPNDLSAHALRRLLFLQGALWMRAASGAVSDPQRRNGE